MSAVIKKKESPSKAEMISGDAENNDSNSVQRKKLGNKKKMKPRPIKETDVVSDVEITSEAFKSSAEFSVSSSSTRKGRVIGKRLPSARPGAGNFVPNQDILNEPFLETPDMGKGRKRAHSRSLSPKGKAKSLTTLTVPTDGTKEKKTTAQARKGRGRIRSTSPSARKQENQQSPAPSDDGSASLSTTRKKKKSASRSQSSSPVRKASSVATTSDGDAALSTYLKKREKARSKSTSPSRKNSSVSTGSPTRRNSNSPTRRNSNVSAASGGSAPAELWTLPRRRSSIQSQSLSPTRTRRPLEKVIEENESAGVSTILRNKKKAMARSQSSSPVRKPKNVSKAIKAGELSPLSAVLKKKTNEINTRRSLSPIREARTVSKALKGEQSSSIANILKKKKSEIKGTSPERKGARSRSSSPLRKARAKDGNDDDSSSSEERSSSMVRKARPRPKSRSLSPVRESGDAPQSPGAISARLRRKKEQFKRSLSFTAKQNAEMPSESRSLSPKKSNTVDDLSATKKRPYSLSPNRGSGMGSRRNSARIDFTGAVIDMDENPSEHSQLTHNDAEFEERPFRSRIQSMQTIRSRDESDDEDENPASTLSFAVEPPISALEFGDQPPDSAQFSIFDASELGSALEDHIKKSRSKDTENSTPSVDDDDSEMAKPSLRHLNPDADEPPKSMRQPAAPGKHVNDGRSTDFPDDTKRQKFLRYLYILSPVQNETPRERHVRALTWASLICDFLAALVSVSTFRTVNTCCDEPILSTLFTADWDLITRVFVYIYISMIFCEVVPVIRHQLPFNLINPTLGFLVTFAVFFDDDIAEAVIMWIIEVVAIICEFVVYRIKRTAYQEKEGLILDIEEEIKQIKDNMRARRRKMKELREVAASPGTFQGRVAKQVDIENGSFPEPPFTPKGPRSSGSIRMDSRSTASSRSPIRKTSNSPMRKVSGSPMRDRSRSISLGSRSGASSLSPVRNFSNSPKRVSSRSPIRERLERMEDDSLGSRSLSPVRESFNPKKRNTSLSPLRRPSASSMIHENNSEASSLSPSRRFSHQMNREPSVRRGSSGAFSTGNRSAGSSPGPSARSGRRIGRSPVRRQHSSTDARFASSDTMRVPMGSEDIQTTGSYSMTQEEEEFEAHRHDQRHDDKKEMQKLVHVRRLKQEQEVDLQYLGYLMVGVVYNFILVTVTMIFIALISRNRGLCIVDMTAPAIFESGQLERCANPMCSGNVQCEYCPNTEGRPEFGQDGVSKCYYSWY